MFLRDSVQLAFEKAQGGLNDFDNEVEYATDDQFEDCSIELMDSILVRIDNLRGQLDDLEDTVRDKRKIKKSGGSL